MAFFGVGYFSDMVYGQTGWDYKTFKLGPDMKAAEQKTAIALNATSPDLASFKARGGKLILYHGWDDPAIPAGNTINYYENVVGTMGQRNAEAFVRLYMVPGMQHCDGGPGAVSFGQDGAGPSDPQQNIRLALEQWVEKATAPTTILAAKYAPDDPGHHPTMTRPLCIYPAATTYKGKGDTNDAANFACAGK
jgi:hypothetical protein